jgi:protein-tyrosine phosphatase
MDPRPRILSLPGVKNFRDMGGYKGADGRTLAWDRLYRSGHLSDFSGKADAHPWPFAVATVIDFRSDAEKKRNPVRFAEGWVPDYHANPIGGNAAAWVQELYERLSTSPFPAQELRDQFILAFETIPVANADGLKRFFEVLAASPEGRPVLFHCTAGKDRTGIAGALLMKVLGVRDDDIMADFLMTNDAVDLTASSTLIAEKMSKRAGRTIRPGDVLPLVGVEAAFLQAAYASIEREFGSLDQYLVKGLGIDTARQDKLRRLFLEA